MEILILLGLLAGAGFAVHAAVKQPGAGAGSSSALPHPTTFNPAPKKATGDAALKAKACAAANSYVASLSKAGLPKPPNWDHLNCDQKVAAVATIVGGGSIAGMIQAAVAATAAINSGKIVDETKKTIDKWTGGVL